MPIPILMAAYERGCRVEVLAFREVTSRPCWMPSMSSLRWWTWKEMFVEPHKG